MLEKDLVAQIIEQNPFHKTALAYFSTRAAYSIVIDGITLNSSEVEILTYVCQHPGVTLSDLASYWGRTKSSVSENLRKLEDVGTLTRERNDNNRREYFIYATEKGTEFEKIYMVQGQQKMEKFYSLWNTKYSTEQFAEFIEMCKFYTECIRNASD